MGNEEVDYKAKFNNAQRRLNEMDAEFSKTKMQLIAAKNRIAELEKRTKSIARKLILLSLESAKNELDVSAILDIEEILERESGRG
jgi:uncharacterized protein involved in exopolysaccharide biosynthesis